MKITWNDLKIDFDHIDKNILIEDWTWLVDDAEPILITSLGDMFLKENSGEIFWLLTGTAEYIKVANSHNEFKEMLKDKTLVKEWFLIPLIVKLKSNKLFLEKGKLYSPIILPILGGKYEVENYKLCNIEVHFSLTGQMNFQLKDIAEGTKIKFTVK